MDEIRAEENKPKSKPKRVSEPKDDNGALFNLQADYYESERSDEAFWKMWSLARTVAERIVRSELKKAKRRADEDFVADKALDATEYVLRRFKYGRGYVVTTNWIDALKRGVQHALDYAKGADRIVDFVPIETLESVAYCDGDL